jgi:hypothetical protein
MPFRDVLAAHPTAKMSTELAEALEAIVDCAQTCSSCSDACLGEPECGDLRRCIRICLDCADVCDVTARLLLRQTESDLRLVRTQVEVCVEACRVCAEECERHAEGHKHCEICARACRRAEQAATRLLQSLRVSR